ncbi:AMP-binding protein [Novosphingobium sp. ZW T3_23]|uniref:AMP-binding protein n=1 Tax=Novosphingobium sp. ZW T3_23 TaxID=3378084 RepID=UPI0038542330
MLAQPRNVASAFVRNAEKNSARTFVKITTAQGATDYSFENIREMAFVYNAHFRKVGLENGSVIAIILRHSVELYAAFLGSMMAGLVPTIMPFPTPKQDREKYWKSHVDLFALSGIEAVFTYEDNVEDIRAFIGDQVSYVATAKDLAPGERCEDIEPGELAVLQHSSGTTALKKGVTLTHEAIFNQVESYSRCIGLNADSRMVSWLPLYHDMGFIACFLMPMVVGCSLSHLDAFTWSAKPTLLLDEIVAFGGEYIWLPNFAYNHIVNSTRSSAEWDLGTVKAIINCSEPCKPDTFVAFRAKPQFRNLSESALQVCYAMAENVFAVSQTPLGSQPRVVTVTDASFREGARIETVGPGEKGIQVLSCGPVIEGTEVAFVLPSGELSREEGLLGEIAITGRSLYSGYYHRPEITAQKLVDGWHRTGDVGFMVDGELYVTGRIDDLLIIRGKNIYAHEVEEAVNALGLIIPGRAVAFTTFSKDKGEASLIVLAESEDIGAETEIKKAVRGAVEAGFGVSLTDFRLVPPRTLRKTTSGKLSRKENSELYLEMQA